MPLLLQQATRAETGLSTVELQQWTDFTGNSIGTMHINGNLTSNQGSETQIEFNSQGTNPGINNDLLVVHGNANLNGGTVQIITTPGSYSAKTKYTFLTYTGTRTQPSRAALWIIYP